MLYTRFVDPDNKSYDFLHKNVYELLYDSVKNEYGIEICYNDIGRGEYGKPFLTGYPEIHFSLSHCQGLCVCLLSDCVCGVDTEKVRSTRENVAKKVFAEKEYEQLMSKTGRDRDIYFTSLWTLKEAYSKADGRGISVMKDVSFYGSSGKILSNYPEYLFRQYRKGEYIISLCQKGKLIGNTEDEFYPF